MSMDLTIINESFTDMMALTLMCPQCCCPQQQYGLNTKISIIIKADTGFFIIKV